MDLLQEVVDDSTAYELMKANIVDALGKLCSALAWTDSHPNRAEILHSLLEMHRDDENPVTAAIITAASWLQEAL